MGVAKTKAKQAKNDSKPRQDFNAIGQLGLKAQGLGNKYKQQLGAKLDATFFADFGNDLVALTAAVPTVITTKDGTVQLTAAQAAALEEGYRLVKGIRETVKSYSPDKDVLLAYGVGTRTSKHLVKDVTAALNKILGRIQAQAAEAQAFGVDQDVADINAALAAIKTADDSQEQGRAAAPQATKNRNAIARRLLAGIKRIAGIGMRAFTKDPTVYANFEALITKTAS
jgi:hypothetical protein